MIRNVKYILTGAFFYTCQIYAQTLGVVKGVVKDKSNNESLPGAVVVLDKTKVSESCYPCVVAMCSMFLLWFVFVLA